MIKDKKELIIYLIFIDILFLNNINLPLLPVVPISLILIIIYFLLHFSIITKDIIIKPFILFSSLLLVSMIFGIIFVPSETMLGMQVVNVAEYNFKRTLQIILLFLYFFFVNNTNFNMIIVKKIMSIFIVWYISLGLLSVINLSQYFKVNSILYGDIISKADFYLNFEALNVFRYRYIFLDANTSIYFFLLISFYLLVLNKNSALYNIMIHLSNMFAVLLSQSTGATICLFIFYFIYFLIYPITKGSTFVKKELINHILVVLIISVFIFIGFFIYLQNKRFSIWDINFISSGINRVSSNDGGGRLSKYFYLFQDRLPFFWGEGYVLVRNGIWFRPHSDILRFLYSFGIGSFILFIYMFRKIFSIKGIMIFIPAIMAFSINSLIDDQKLFALFLVIYAIFIQKHKINSNSMNR